MTQTSTPDDRPRPTPEGGHDPVGSDAQGDDDAADTSSKGDASSSGNGEQGDGKPRLDRSDESQHFVDQSIMDFDPDDGLYSGTVVTGETSIDGPHIGEDGTVDEKEQEQFLEDGKKQAQESGLLDDEGNPTGKGKDEQAPQTDDAKAEDDATE